MHVVDVQIQTCQHQDTRRFRYDRYAISIIRISEHEEVCRFVA